MFLLYYQYVEISNPQEICDWQIQICEVLNLKGRIRVSPEGLNGTLSGEDGNIEEYVKAVDARSELLSSGPIHWKRSGFVQNLRSHDEQCFKDLSVKVTKEVVSLDLNKYDRDILKSSKVFEIL